MTGRHAGPWRPRFWRPWRRPRHRELVEAGVMFWLALPGMVAAVLLFVPALEWVAS